MNVSESIEVGRLCRSLDGMPFPDPLGVLNERAHKRMSASAPMPTPVLMHQQFALEVRYGSVDWHIDPNVGDSGWVDAEVYLDEAKKLWAQAYSLYFETRVLTRWVSEPEVRA